VNPVQYLIANHTLNMTPGKLAAQVAHASQMGLRLNAKTEHGNPYDESIVNRWMLGGHYAKVVLEADNLYVAERYLFDRGFSGAAIIDEGRTEFGNTLTFTALGFPVLDKDNPHVREAFSQFKLYGSALLAQQKLEARVRSERVQSAPTPSWFQKLLST
jgi:peptidyl-tRNA hydrolase